MDLGHRNTQSDILILLHIIGQSRGNYVPSHTPDSSVQFHQIITDVLEASQQMQDSTVFVLDIFQ